MSKPTQAEFEGQMVPAEELEFEAEKEPWSVYKLEDGTIFKTKQALASIYRIKDKFRPDGDPIYVFKMAGMANADVPEKLKRKA